MSYCTPGGTPIAERDGRQGSSEDSGLALEILGTKLVFQAVKTSFSVPREEIEKK